MDFYIFKAKYDRPNDDVHVFDDECSPVFRRVDADLYDRQRRAHFSFIRRPLTEPAHTGRSLRFWGTCEYAGKGNFM